MKILFYPNLQSQTHIEKTPTFKANLIFKEAAQTIEKGSLNEVKRIKWLHTRNENGDSLLHYAMKFPKPDIIEYLLKNIYPNTKNKKGLTCFNYATSIGNLEALKILSSYKFIDINTQDNEGNTPLINSINNFEIFKYLLELGANPNIVNYDRFSTAHYIYDKIDMLRLLKNHKANLNLQDLNGQTIFHYLAESKYANLVKKYIELGVDINKADIYNKSPLFYARDFIMIDELVENGTNLNIQDVEGQTVLHKAYKTKNEKLVKYFESKNINVDLIDKNGQTAQDLADGNKNCTNTTSNVGFGKVVGMDELKELLQEIVINPLKDKKSYQEYGLTPSNGILLHGLPGCGKTFIAEALAEETERHFYKIKPSDVSNPYFGVDTQAITSIFQQAKSNPPSIVFIDEMDAIAPCRDKLGNDSAAQDINQRVNELLEQMNNCAEKDVFIIGATNHPELIDSAIKRTGRLDTSIFVPPPDIKARIALLKKEINSRPFEKGIKYEELASKTENYTALEIREIVNKAALKAKKCERKISNEDLYNALNFVKPNITKADIEKYKQANSPADFKDKLTISNSSKIKGFAKVAGMKDLKETLVNDVILPLSNVFLIEKYNLKPANGILLYGPPGTGKTFISEALAEETGRYFIPIKPSSVGSSFQYEAALNIKKVFEEAEYNSPSIIFIDEIEALAPARERLFSTNNDAHTQISELLQQLNNCVDKDIFVIAATNEPQLIDKAIMRTGRFDKSIFVPPPDLESRTQLFKMDLEKRYHEHDINYEYLAKITEYYTASDITNVLNTSAQIAYLQRVPLSTQIILSSIKKYKPSLNKQIVLNYQNKIK